MPWSRVFPTRNVCLRGSPDGTARLGRHLHKPLACIVTCARTERGAVPDSQQVSQTQPLPIRAKAAPNNLRQTPPAVKSSPPHDSGGMLSYKVAAQRAVTTQHHAQRKGRHPATVTCDVYARQAFFGSKHLTTLFLFTIERRGTNAAHTSAGTRRSDTLRQESTLTTPHKARLTQRAEAAPDLRPQS